MVIFLLNIAVILGYLLLMLMTWYVDTGYVHAFSLIGEARGLEESAYFVTGRLLVFLNLWAALFYVNAGFFRDRAVGGPRLAVAAVASTLLTGLVFVTGAYVVSISGLLLIRYFGWNF